MLWIKATTFGISNGNNGKVRLLLGGGAREAGGGGVCPVILAAVVVVARIGLHTRSKIHEQKTCAM